MYKPFHALTVTGPAEAVLPPPKTLPTLAVPLPAVKVYRSSSTFVIENPEEASITTDVNPSKGSTERKRTTSHGLFSCPGCVTVIIALPEEPVRKAFCFKRTVTAGSVRSGRGSRRA